MMVEIGGTVVSLDVLKEAFRCDLERCKGACCVEGDAGAPVEADEVAGLERAAEALEGELTEAARAVIRRQGVVYTDADGQTVTSIVDGRDCVFAVRDAQGRTLCAIDRARREGRLRADKPVSCALYPVRLTRLGGAVALNYHRWSVCAGACRLGRETGTRVYEFVRGPLIRRFGPEWWAELELTAAELRRAGYLD